MIKCGWKSTDFFNTISPSQWWHKRNLKVTSMPVLNIDSSEGVRQ